MSLTPRQSLLYEHRIDLWKPTVSVSGGIPNTTYTKEYENVSCYIEFTPNLDDPNTAGRIRADMIFTIDHFHMDADQEIEADWLIVNKTLNPDGTQAVWYGHTWKCRGDAQPIVDNRRRRSKKRQVMASQDPKPPLEVAP